MSTTKNWVDVTEFIPDVPTEQQYKVIATAIMDERGAVIFEGETGIFPDSINVPGENPVGPQDGLTYLRALKQYFDAPQLCATDVQTGERG